MHRFILIFAFGLLSSDVRAGWVLGTNIPTSTPLKLDAGATSDPIFVNVGMSGNSEANIVAWQFRLVIVSLGGATGTVQFESPLTGSVANPANYLFGNVKWTPSLGRFFALRSLAPRPSSALAG